MTERGWPNSRKVALNRLTLSRTLRWRVTSASEIEFLKNSLAENYHYTSIRAPSICDERLLHEYSLGVRETGEFEIMYCDINTSVRF